MQDSNFSGKRMIDHLIASPRFIPIQPKFTLDMDVFERRERQTRSRLAKAEVFEISNVSDYFWFGSPKEVWDVYRDFPCVMPPFEHLWLEYRSPSKTKSETCPERPWEGVFSRCGVLITTHPAPPNAPPGMEDIKHFQTCDLFFQGFVHHASGEICGPALSICYGISAAGEPRPFNGNKTIQVLPVHLKEYEHLATAEKYNWLHQPLYPALLALTFLNCRNTVLVDRKPDDKLDRVHRDRHSRPLVSFKTLEIEPIKKLFSKTAGPGETIQRALHISRGHFKDYREHGLFGTRKGLYWWGQQVRGSVERGAVIKDYKMGDPNTGGSSPVEG